MTASVIAFVKESNRIEGILREPTRVEIDAHTVLLDLPKITIPALQEFVFAVQPGARLRETADMNVRIGNHIAPKGGMVVVGNLGSLLHLQVIGNPYAVHQAYEELHPFMDGNGRSGRALWLSMMRHHGQLDRALRMGFLHLWYYQSLEAGR